MPDTDHAYAVALQLVPPSETGAKDWFFTFGSGHAHPNGYVKIHGTFGEARDAMFARFGPKWCMQYGSADEAGVSRWNLREVQ